ncbi:MAG: RecQ family ATP-dependent DNA helicase [Pseudomonadales bacterium]|nr:RecQ family ATP-dependent DNA helicase [Pseudomonadales bacterium]
MTEALEKLDDFAEGTAFLLGHNIVAFDLPYLLAAKPDLRLLQKPAVDTLQLNPLAFPRNPYHHLVKHYQEGQLKRGRINDPELDARLVLDVFNDQFDALQRCNTENPALILVWHWLCTVDKHTFGLNAFFSTVRKQTRPADSEARQAIQQLLNGSVCVTHAGNIIDNAEKQGWGLAYALAWLSVAGGNSVMPPWVRHQYPQAGELISLLRDTACSDATCSWCAEHHDACRELQRWFGFNAFRPEPRGEDGRPLQQSIVESAMRGEHVLGILPTGTGKSLCYQIPALSRYEKTGVLTVVISPLVALMADQVTGLEARGITSSAAINGMLSMPERGDVLDRVRLGDIGILIISPEQLRNNSVRKVLAQREIGAWVLDEAHCISKWGHDFRPDYRYVGRFIREKAGTHPIPPVLCLTATAKPDVVKDIVKHFSEKVGIELTVFDGGAKRDNLNFSVVPTSTPEKFAHVYQMVNESLPPDVPGGAIVYCATRRQTEDMANFLREKDVPADYFHSALQPESKKEVQRRFIKGDLRVIVATNAFGMGIDKPDVRLVVHADIPGSLENYLQEAGRAGRDRESASCVLMYTQEDVEKQFGMSARSRLTRQEIQSILGSLRQLDRKKRFNGAVVATTGEILEEDEDAAFTRDPATDDTRARTAIAWLEESLLLSREENRVTVFPSSLRVDSLDAAKAKLQKKDIGAAYRQQLLGIVEALLSADADEGISTDELMGLAGLNSDKLRAALHDLEHMGLASNDTALTAFVHVAVENSSQKRLEEAVSLEQALIDVLRESAADLQKGEASMLHLRLVTQKLKDEGHTAALPEKLWRIIRGLTLDGRDEESGVGSLGLKRFDSETLQITLQRDWTPLNKTAELRRAAAARLLEHLLDTLPTDARGTDQLAETTLGKLLAAIEGDLILKAETRHRGKLLDRALMWLHEMEIIRLNKGLAVFRPAMTIQLAKERRNFVKADFQPLRIHYQEQVLQIHIMAEYVQLGLQAMADALQLTMDYFSLDQDTFLDKWLPGREKELTRQTTPESWRSIVEDLDNPWQQRIVADDREQTNVLVLAGPGSGKTRVLVHRIAYLVRVRREKSRGILALAYNRHAALEIRKRLNELIGDDAKGIMVMTCHALAMRLLGASFSKRPMDDASFRQVLIDAAALLKGEGLPPDEADEQRQRLLSGFRWILVDEYQDVGPEQYDLISALAGRTLNEDDSKLTLFAVGDDDQNIYSFDGASVEFIRRFEKDYAAKPSFLLENYRSTQHIITAANLMISPAQHRMKVDHPITVDRGRKKAQPGGQWQSMDPVGKGRVQILPAGNTPAEQAVAVMAELKRLAGIAPAWDWRNCAVIAREWLFLEPVRAWCELHGIPVQMADEGTIPLWRLRETQALVNWIRSRESKLVSPESIYGWLDRQATGPWCLLLRQAMDAYVLEISLEALPVEHFFEWLAEWGRDLRRRQTGLLLLTAHRAKGLEFDHVAVLDGAWERTQKDEDADASRRLYYVAMTRAKQTLLLARQHRVNPLLTTLPASQAIVQRPNTGLPAAPTELNRHYLQLSLREIDLGFAGRYPQTRPLHGAIAALVPGDPLLLKQGEKTWELTNLEGLSVCRLARAFAPPEGKQFVAAKVLAVVVRQRDDSEPEYQAQLRCDRWEVVIPELVYE